MRALLVFPFALSLALSLAFTASCLRQTEFQCTTDTQCGPNGTCQSVSASVGYCSFPDSECGQRFGASAGQYANQCVGMQPGGDSSVTIDGRMIDAPPAARCPANFMALPNDATNPHRYRKLAANANWDTQRQACLALSANAFLAVPNDATELTGLFMLAGNVPFWVGIDDRAVEGMYIQSTGGAATFLPWAAGQPDNAGGGGGEDCVLATGTTISDESCTGGGASQPGVCECVP
ncbi:MAG TPA: lectin-like protein [Kofleriaceae bacterium]|nr:lectin-like protein [Kofleriaceae bacterium]